MTRDEADDAWTENGDALPADAGDFVDPNHEELVRRLEIGTLWSDAADALMAEAATLIRQQSAALARKDAALRRQTDNMAFILNHATVGAWCVKFSRELAEDRQALETKDGEKA